MRYGKRSPLRLGLPQAALALVVLLAACAESASRLTSPDGRAEQHSSRTGQPSAEVTCRKAVRTPSGTYLQQQTKISAPVAGSAGAPGEMTEVGLLVWAEGTPDPVSIISCEVPNTPAAKQWVRAHLLRGRPELDIARPENNASVRARKVAEMVAAARPANTGSGETLNTIQVVEENCLIDEFGNPCQGEELTPDDGLIEEPPPPDPIDYETIEPDLSWTDPAVIPGAPINCTHQTQYIHISGRDISVHGQTRCTAPVSLITLTVVMQKRRCVWIVCWWADKYAKGPQSSPPGRASFELPFHIPCEIGYWTAKTRHQVTPPPGYTIVYSTGSWSYSGVGLIVRQC